MTRKTINRKRKSIPVTREEALERLYDVLDDIRETVDYCHAREVKKDNHRRAEMMSDLRISINEKRDRIGILLGIEDPIQMETQIQCALYDAEWMW